MQTIQQEKMMDSKSEPIKVDYTKKIFERNPDTGVIRWRYFGESHEKYGWPHYGNILDEKKIKKNEFFLN